MPTDLRLTNLKLWLASLPADIRLDSLRPASADASFRRYFRVDLGENGNSGSSAIVMDAPPPQEDVQPFIAVAQLFGATGVSVPTVLAQDVAQGFLLLSDLGATTYLEQLNADTAPALYLDAIDALVHIQMHSQPGVLPDYDRALLQRELMLFPDWYVAKHLGVTLSEAQHKSLNGVFDALLANNLAQPQVYVHRDYHARNLMVLPVGNPGILDFQDAVYGPITYDLVSLLRDAYIEWDEEQVLDWAIRYWERAKRAGLPVNPDIDAFYRDFEFMGLQRHLKVLGIFARLYHRDGKDAYLKDLPLVMRYTRKVAGRYKVLAPLIVLLDELEDKAPSVGYTF
ncbi:aminoglycoside phosphotransferase family protein [Actimicrobium sp. CCI2.3]|uniref:aminoglycoside phosphotransferase family protein n=1 Tax=Actimicrobium sp. CCI2.3 TaxID=3048616 RepID=UPI002AB34D98|nr:phosphotransferase [Actimicrobium sp. CCI2.3]MDY7573765.1 phosphotransferase [Actimicrobium sp. CCI2.3]MEB0022376.1 phosphotransferase [Actimicrobium sp. CCI2.3]